MSQLLITPRRSLQLAKHHIEAALSIIERNEDARLALADLLQAMKILRKTVLPYVRSLAKGWARGVPD